MRTDPRPACPRPAHRHLAMAVALAVLALAGGRDAAGTTISAAEAREPGAAGDHLCKCKSCRGASSCCCSHAEARPAPAPVNAPRPVLSPAPGKATAPPSGPCVDSAPCGGGESTPATPAGVAAGKVASLTSPAGLAPAADGRPLAFKDPARLPELAPSRLDEPPEAPSRP